VDTHWQQYTVVFHQRKFLPNIQQPIQISEYTAANIRYQLLYFVEQKFFKATPDCLVLVSSWEGEKPPNFRFLGCHSWLVVVPSQLLAGSNTLEQVWARVAGSYILASCRLWSWACVATPWKKGVLSCHVSFPAIDEVIVCFCLPKSAADKYWLYNIGIGGTVLQ